MKTKHPLKDFATTVEVDFEGYKMPLMKGYDSYLRSIFGDYMKLPPQDQRVPRRNLVYANFEEPYAKFKGVYYMKGIDK